jgi:hypothetical protein
MDPDKGTWTTSRRPFSAALSANKPNELLDRLSQIEVDVFKLELTRLELREIQDVIDEREQVAAGALDDRGQPSLPSGQFGGEEQFGRADDAVHRGSNLVAHLRQKMPLHDVGSLGGFLGCDQVVDESRALHDTFAQARVRVRQLEARRPQTLASTDEAARRSGDSQPAAC